MSFVNILIIVMQGSYYLTQFTFIPLGLLLRFFIVIKNNTLTTSQKILVTLDFTSFSFFLNLGQKSRWEKLYYIFLITYAVFAFFAFGFGIHMYF